MELPVLDCGGCARCCTDNGDPPEDFFEPEGAAAAEAAGLPVDQWPLSPWAASLPEDLRAELLAYHAGGQLRQNLPCLWLDLATLRCRHYEHRPEVCRDFEVGGEDCRCLRRGLE